MHYLTGADEEFLNISYASNIPDLEKNPTFFFFFLNTKIRGRTSANPYLSVSVKEQDNHPISNNNQPCSATANQAKHCLK